MKLNNGQLYVYVGTLDLTDVAYLGSEEMTFSHLTSNKLMIGYKKPIRHIYIDIKTKNNFNSKLTAKIFNGDTWESLAIKDETFGYKKSGFITFDDNVADSKLFTYQGIEAHWVEFSINVSSSPVISRFINLVFCNELDLKKIRSDIDSYVPEDSNSFILSLVQARDEILNDINNSNKNIYSSGSYEMRYSLFNQFDLFDISELRIPAAYKTLKIKFEELSHIDNDKFEDLKLSYEKEYNSKFELFRGSKLSLDLNDDGIESEEEKEEAITEIRLIK